MHPIFVMDVAIPAKTVLCFPDILDFKVKLKHSWEVTRSTMAEGGQGELQEKSGLETVAEQCYTL